MNTRKAIQPVTINPVFSVSISASRKRFAAGLSDGLRAFRTDNCLTTYHPPLPRDVSIAIAEILDDRYYAYVCRHKGSKVGPSVVVFWDAVLGQELSHFNCHEPILSVRLTPRWMAVILEQRTVLFQYQEVEMGMSSPAPIDDRASGSASRPTTNEVVRAPNLVHSIHQTALNLHGLASLSDGLIALPAPSIGQVHLISLDMKGPSKKKVVRAHNSSIRCLALSEDASLLATASEQGTLVRVYNTTTLDQIAELRRGMDSAIILDLAFSPGNRWLASTSDKGTLHVFDLRPPEPNTAAAVGKDRDAIKRHRKTQSNAAHRLSGTSFEKDSLSGMSAGRCSPAPSTALVGGAGTAYQGSVQEYYGLRPPPAAAAPPAREAAVSAMAAFKASPFAPRVFKDPRSVASAPFYTGNDPPHWQGGPAYSWTTAPNGGRKRVKNPILPLPNNPSGRPPKGVLAFAPPDTGHSDDDGARIYVIGGGSDPRWEMFELLPRGDNASPGGWALVNQGFRKYLTRQFVD